MSLDVLTSGSKVWRYGYRVHGKQKTFTIGNYPDTSLAEARTSRDTAKKLVSAGIDPSQQKQIEKRKIAEDSFQAIAETWLAQMKPEWSDSHYGRIKRYLNKDVYPVIGKRTVNEIEAPELITIIITVSNRGAVDAAKRVKGFIQQVSIMRLSMANVPVIRPKI